MHDAAPGGNLDPQVLDGAQDGVSRSLALDAEQVGDAVAEQDEGEPGVHAGEAGHGRHPPAVRQELPALGDHHPPLGRRRAHAQSQEAQRRRGEDDQDDVRGEEDDRRRDGVGQDVAQEDAPAAEPQRPRGGDVLEVLLAQHLAAHQPRVRAPTPRRRSRGRC